LGARQFLRNEGEVRMVDTHDIFNGKEVRIAVINNAYSGRKFPLIPFESFH